MTSRPKRSGRSRKSRSLSRELEDDDFGSSRMNFPPNIEGMTSLKVDNITQRTGVNLLKKVFSKYGDLGDVYVPRYPDTFASRGFAFVRFVHKRDAEEAMRKMNGFVLDGRVLSIQMARYARPSPSRQSSSLSRRGGPPRSGTSRYPFSSRNGVSRFKGNGGGFRGRGLYRRSPPRSRRSASRSRSRSRSRDRKHRSSRRHRSRSKSRDGSRRSRDRDTKRRSEKDRSRSPHEKVKDETDGEKQNSPSNIKRGSSSKSRSKSPAGGINDRSERSSTSRNGDNATEKSRHSRSRSASRSQSRSRDMSPADRERSRSTSQTKDRERDSSADRDLDENTKSPNNEGNWKRGFNSNDVKNDNDNTEDTTAFSDNMDDDGN